MDRTTGNGGRSLTTCRKDASVLADGLPCNFCGYSSAGRARPRHGRGHEFETRYPLHFGCVFSLRCCVTWCWQLGMCATQGPEPRAARHHIRRDARVWAQPKWKEFAPQSLRSCPQGAQPIGLAKPDPWAWLDGRLRTFSLRALEHRTRHQTGTLVELALQGGNRPQRLGGAGTRDRMEFIASLTQRKSAGLSSRKSRVWSTRGARWTRFSAGRRPRANARATPHEAPDFCRDSSAGRAAR